jgi:hypothetical protein
VEAVRFEPLASVGLSTPQRDRGRFDVPPSARRPRVASGIVPGGDPKPGNSAPFPSRPSRKPSYPSQDGAKFDRRPPASRFPSAESPQIVIAVARQDGRFGIGWGPSYPEGADMTMDQFMDIEEGWSTRGDRV